MSYEGYSRSEYASEARAILRQRYKENPVMGGAAEAAIDSAYRVGVSPGKAAQRAAFASRLRRKERYWHHQVLSIHNQSAEAHREARRLTMKTERDRGRDRRGGR